MPPYWKGTKGVAKEEKFLEILEDVKSGKYISCYAVAKAIGIKCTLLEQRLNSTH